MAENESSATSTKPESAIEDPTRKMTTIAQSEKGGKRISLMVTPDKLRAYLLVTPLAPFLRVAIEDFNELLEQKGVIIIDEKREELLALIEEINQPDFKVEQLENMDPFLVTQGIPPRHGADGRLEWNVDVPEPGRLKFQEDEHGNVDLRSLGRVVNVREDDLLLTLHEPTKGEPGTDVFGKPIAAKNGEKIKISKGKGVKIDEEGLNFFAEVEGCVKWTGAAVSVDPVYLVTGDLDYATGNIKFNGTVIVQKDVLDGFEIEARDGIEIQGLTGQARLVAENGDVTCRGGMQGNNKGHITCGKNIVAKYLNNTNIDCDGDVLVEREVVNCQINCGGRVLAPAGTIIGGRVVALGGIEAASVGSETGTRTPLLLNYEFFQTPQSRELDTKIEGFKKKKDLIENRLGPIIENPETMKRLDEQRRQTVLKLIEALEQLQGQVDSLENRRDQEIRKYAARIGNEIIVRKMLFPGVDIRIDTCRQVFNQPIAGPVKLKPNYAKGTIQVSSC